MITVFKSSNEIISTNATNQSPKQFTFSLKNPQLIEEINRYLQTFPLSSAENDLLQAKIQKTPASLNGNRSMPSSFPFNQFRFSDWSYCTLLRSGNPLCQSLDCKPRVPENKYLSQDFYLPIDQTATKDHLLHLIENNKILFVNGPPAIGKSLRVELFFQFEMFDSLLFSRK